MTVRVAVASGKGGTGKTMLATNLAVMLSDQGKEVRLLDADVEEPDCHLFLRPQDETAEPVSILVPVVDDERCSACGACADVCAFSAITVIGASVLVFPELCHACGACSLLCPESALHEEGRVTGEVRRGVVARPGGREFTLVTGVLAIGEAKAVPVTKAVLAVGDDDLLDVTLIDAPPGTSCSVIEAVRDSDVVVLVTEPTPFGLNDLRLAVEMVRALGLRTVVAVNRAGVGDDRVQRYCEEEGLEIVLEMPDDRRVAEAYSRGEVMVDAVPDARERLQSMWARITAAHAEGVRP